MTELPATLPASSCRSEMAVAMISTRRDCFSSTTLAAICWPNIRAAMKKSRAKATVAACTKPASTSAPSRRTTVTVVPRSSASMLVPAAAALASRASARTAVSTAVRRASGTSSAEVSTHPSTPSWSHASASPASTSAVAAGSPAAVRDSIAILPSA